MLIKGEDLRNYFIAFVLLLRQKMYIVQFWDSKSEMFAKHTL